MRILYSHYLNEAEHPAVCMVEHISRELRAMGHDVLVHASSGLGSGEENTGTNEHVQSPSRTKRKLKQWLWFSKEMSRNYRRVPRDYQVIQETRPDIVLARQDAYCWSVVTAAKRSGVPVVTYADAPVAYEVRTFNPEGRWHPPGLVESIEKWGLKNSKAVIAVSRPGAAQVQRYGISIPTIANPNGVDPNRFSDRCSEVRKAVLDSFGLSADKTVVGFQGSFRSFHGLDRLKALMLDLKGREDVAWLLIGDGPERTEIEAAVAKEVDVCFTGRQPAAEMGKLLSSIDIAVAPHAQMDGDFYFCPLKILEYAASGCAIVASDQGDIPHLLDEGGCGEIIDVDDLSEWRTKIEQLLNEPVRRRELGRRARQHVLKNFTWSHTARRVETVLLDALQTCACETTSRLPTAEEVG